MVELMAYNEIFKSDSNTQLNGLNYVGTRKRNRKNSENRNINESEKLEEKRKFSIRRMM